MKQPIACPVILGTGAVLMTLTLAGRPAGASRADDLIGSRDPFGQLRTLHHQRRFRSSRIRSSRISAPTAAPASPATGPTRAGRSRRTMCGSASSATGGLDPIFRTNDGSNCEGADVDTLSKRRAAFSLLLTRGLIRVGLDVPAGAEFVIVGVDDPYRCGAPLTTRVDVSPAAAVDEPAVPERGDVGRPRVVGRRRRSCRTSLQQANDATTRPRAGGART